MAKWKDVVRSTLRMATSMLVNGKMMYSTAPAFSIITKTRARGRESGKTASVTAGSQEHNQRILQEIKIIISLTSLPAEVITVLDPIHPATYSKDLNKA